MELLTYIQNPLKFQLPPFKHPTKVIQSNNSIVSSNTKSNNANVNVNGTASQYCQENTNLFYTENVSIPDKILLNDLDSVNLDLGLGIGNVGQEQQQNGVRVCLLFGYQLKLKDWEKIRSIYPGLNVSIKLYRGNQVTQISQSILCSKSFLKGQYLINNPQKTLIKKSPKQSQSHIPIYTVQLSLSPCSCPKKILYYLPSVLPPSPLEHLKSRYCNHKFLQILNEYLSLDNNNISCYKDLAHHQFQAILYSGKVCGFEVFVKIWQGVEKQMTQSFVEKLALISMTDKHLLDQVDPLDFGSIKKQIRDLCLEQKRIRRSLTFQKIKIVEQIQNTLQFLNLKQTYPHKLTYTSITPEMLKRIKSQNIDNKALWIKEQNFIIKNLDARLLDLQATKNRYKNIQVEEEKGNYLEIQAIRNQIRNLEVSIKYEQAEKNVQMWREANGKEDKDNGKSGTLQKQGKLKMKTRLTHESENNLKNKEREKEKEKQREKEKLLLDQMEKQKILKYQMIRAQFQMQKQFVRRKAQYAKAAEQIFNYLTDC